MFHPDGGRVNVRALVLTNHDAIAPGSHSKPGERVLIAGSLEPQPASPSRLLRRSDPLPELVRTTCSPRFSRRRLASLSHVFPGAARLHQETDFDSRMTLPRLAGFPARSMSASTS